MSKALMPSFLNPSFVTLEKLNTIEETARLYDLLADVMEGKTPCRDIPEFIETELRTPEQQLQAIEILDTFHDRAVALSKEAIPATPEPNKNKKPKSIAQEQKSIPEHNTEGIKSEKIHESTATKPVTISQKLALVKATNSASEKESAIRVIRAGKTPKDRIRRFLATPADSLKD